MITHAASKVNGLQGKINGCPTPQDKMDAPLPFDHLPAINRKLVQAVTPIAMPIPQNTMFLSANVMGLLAH